MLNGSYFYEEEFDEPTKELMEEITQIGSIIPTKSVNTNFTRKGWQQRWRKLKEKTSSSVSHRHFGHYKAGAKSALISHLHALKTSVAVRRGVHLERWSYGLSVMIARNRIEHDALPISVFNPIV